MDIIAVDISGRHEYEGEYFMVGAAVAANITPSHINCILGIKTTLHRQKTPPQLSDVVDIVTETVMQLMQLKQINQIKTDITIVAEKGDFFNEDEWRINAMMPFNFKYMESIGERRMVEAAHHASISTRDLLLACGLK